MEDKWLMWGKEPTKGLGLFDPEHYRAVWDKIASGEYKFPKYPTKESMEEFFDKIKEK
jgi:hypothetical protein